MVTVMTFCVQCNRPKPLDCENLSDMRLALLSLLLSSRAAPIGRRRRQSADYQHVSFRWSPRFAGRARIRLGFGAARLNESQQFRENARREPRILRYCRSSPAICVDPRRRRGRSILHPREGGVDGAFPLDPEHEMSSSVKMSLRVRDTSQNATSLGDDVPVVRANRQRTMLTIFDVPVDPKYRASRRRRCV